ncbi:M20 family metallopeptidase [Mesosutterella sp. OilRF-GAM-744-9]|uniref:M20 family metallopeptidase n=1 Tax=Mesosutterella porci TaxID=2915351 RepID=A0ABS9MN13_9BURK|nr:M20 family metallopeptidase [Mesosutterella sp. oilRF-744-WT-GAM-9]MCG5030010.1 M20 family metallopeptidase [Mesosutterella sp. oilRF-744-WT-GAM-9]
MSLLEDYIRDLKEIVNFDSGTGNAAGVTRAAGIMQRHYESIGFKAELVDLGDEVGRGMLAVNKPGAAHYDVLLNAHLDTVFPDGTAAERPFRLEGDRITGPGCMDCKGGVMAFYYALKTLPRETLDRLSIAVACNPDEETGSKNSHEWLSELAKKSSCALVGEPGRPNNALIRSRKGIEGYIVNFTGRAAHAGNNPEKGRDANLAMMRFTLEAVKLNDMPAGVSVCATLVKGGTIQNSISDTAEVYFDTRFKTDEQGAALDRAMRALAAKSWGENIGVTLRTDHSRPAMPYSELSRPIVEKISEAARKAGFEPLWADAGGGSDASYMARAGIPAVDGCGPAGGGAHSKNEYLLVNTIEQRIAMIRNFLVSL